MNLMTDDEILASLNAGCGSALSVLYDRYAGPGVRYAHAILRDRGEAEEAVQEVFCRLLKPLRNGVVDPGRGGFGAFYFKALRNRCIDVMRRRSRSRRFLSLREAAAVPAPEGAQGKEGGEIDLEAQVRKAMEALPSGQGDALKLRLEGGLSYEQIAQVLDCTKAQVRTWIFRARRNLEENLSREGLLP
jgi:RNA polymerase sigma factor (sigma-70 family)